MKTYGKAGEVVTVLLLFVLLLPSTVAYLVLIADLEVPLLEYLFNDSHALGPATRPLAMAITLAAMSPFCFQDSLHALRFTSFISFSSTLLLAGAVLVRAAQCAGGWGDPPEQCGAGPGEGDSLYPESARDVLLAIPVFATAFLCHFNVLPVHNEIHDADRIRSVIHWTMGIVLALYLLVGLGGFYVGRERTCGNVLLNFPADDGAMALGRAGLVVTLSMSLPLLAVPCRNTMLRLFDLVNCDWARGRRRRRSSVGIATEETPLVAAPGPPTGGADALGADPEAAAAASEGLGGGSRDRAAAQAAVATEAAALKAGRPRAPRRARSARGEEEGAVSQAELAVGTLVVLGAALGLAMLVPSVVVVWSLVGSTVSVLVAFTLPTAFFVAVQRMAGEPPGAVGWLSRACLALSLLAVVVCSAASALSLSQETLDLAGEDTCNQ